jgi:glutamate-ammonia-ligase adenylyltransferase
LLRASQHRLRLDGAEKTRVDLALEPQLIKVRDVVLTLWQKIFLAPSDAEQT